jgi:hypothetical protein
LDDERRAAAGETVEAEPPTGSISVSGGKRTSPQPASAIDLAEIRYLVSRLSELVDGQ